MLALVSYNKRFGYNKLSKDNNAALSNLSIDNAKKAYRYNCISKEKKTKKKIKKKKKRLKLYYILKGEENDNLIVATSKNKYNCTNVSFLQESGFGVGLGDWNRNNWTDLIRGISQLKTNLNDAIYYGGILSYLNNKVRKPIKEIKSRIKFIFFRQYALLQKEYNIVNFIQHITLETNLIHKVEILQ